MFRTCYYIPITYQEDNVDKISKWWELTCDSICSTVPRQSLATCLRLSINKHIILTNQGLCFTSPLWNSDDYFLESSLDWFGRRFSFTSQKTSPPFSDVQYLHTSYPFLQLKLTLRYQIKNFSTSRTIFLQRFPF